LGDVSCLSPPWLMSSCPRIPSWASFCVRRATALAHT
jgi:hypothetical protein